MDSIVVNALLALLVAFDVAALLGPLLIPVLHRLKFGQNVREEGPASHLKKSGTPTMESEQTVKKKPLVRSRRPAPCRSLKVMLPPETAASRGVTRNSRDFVTECPSRWKMAAT